MNRFFKVFQSAAFAAIVSTSLTGCATSAANMAAKQPEQVNLDILAKGTPRSLIVARLGMAVGSFPHGSGPETYTVDVYKFVQGYSAGSRTLRVFGHTTANALTLGLWEPTGQSIEGYARGNTVSIEVTYDTDSRLAAYCILEGRETIEEDLDKAALAPSCAAPTKIETASTNTSTQTAVPP